MMSKCSAYNLHNEIDILATEKQLEMNLEIIKYSDSISILNNDKYSVLFNYGILILWGLTEEEELHLFTLLDLEKEKVSKVEELEFGPTINSKSGIHDDYISIAEGSEREYLTYSHALAQSIKLSEYEKKVNQAIKDTEQIPLNIATTGTSKLRKNDIAKMRGYLFLVKNEVSLRSDLLDVPEYFWQNPVLRPLYEKACDYLELNSRIEVLNKRSTVILELQQMLSDEEKHKHNSFLGGTIILLITLGICTTIFLDLLN